MLIKITQLEHTGISLEDYSVGDIVEATKVSDYSVTIPMPDRDGSTYVGQDYLLLDKWYEVLDEDNFVSIEDVMLEAKEQYLKTKRLTVEQSIDRYDS